MRRRFRRRPPLRAEPQRVIAVGQAVRYHSIIVGPHDGRVYVVRAVGELPVGTHVAWLREKSGCVAVEALSAAGGSSS